MEEKAAPSGRRCRERLREDRSTVGSGGLMDHPDRQVGGDAIRRAFTRIFWGILLIFLDIRLGGIDVLADPIGYVMIANALEAVLCLHPHFATARTLAKVMAFLSMVNVVDPRFLGHGLYSSNCTLFLLVFAAGIGDLLMVGYLCTGIIEVARLAGKHDLARIADVRLKLYVCVLFLSSSLVQFVRSLRPEALPPAVVLSAISIFVATGLMMDLMLKASDQLAGLGGPSTE